MMGKRTFEVVVHREKGGYWSEIPELPGCLASGGTVDELLAGLTEGVALYLGDEQPERLVVRVTGLVLEAEYDVRPPGADAGPYEPGRRTRRSHPDE